MSPLARRILIVLALCGAIAVYRLAPRSDPWDDALASLDDSIQSLSLQASDPSLRQTLVLRLDELERIGATDADPARARRRQAEVLARKGEFLIKIDLKDGAREAFESALALVPDEPRANADFGIFLLVSGDPKGALDHLRLAPRSPEILLASARAELAQNDLKEARALVEEAIAASPRMDQARFMLAEVDVRTGKVDEARAIFDALIAHKDRMPGLFAGIANIFRASGNSALAAVYVEKALARGVDPVTNRITLGDLAMEQLDFEKARDAYAAVVALGESQVPAAKLLYILAKLAFCEAHTGRLGAAREHLGQAEKLAAATGSTGADDPSLRSLAMAQARVAQAQGDLVTAENRYKRLLELGGIFPTVYLLLSELHAQQGLYTTALQEFRTYMRSHLDERSERDASMEYGRMGVLSFKAGDRQGALHWLDRKRVLSGSLWGAEAQVYQELTAQGRGGSAGPPPGDTRQTSPDAFASISPSGQASPPPSDQASPPPSGQASATPSGHASALRSGQTSAPPSGQAPAPRSGHTSMALSVVATLPASTQALASPSGAVPAPSSPPSPAGASRVPSVGSTEPRPATLPEAPPGLPGLPGHRTPAASGRPRMLPVYEDIASRAGIRFVHTLTPPIIYTPQGSVPGVGVADLDGDGFLDLIFLDGGDQMGNRSSVVKIYRAQGDGTYQDVSSLTGIDVRQFGIGVTACDIDADGYVDLAITTLDGLFLLRNQGDGTFRPWPGADPLIGGWTSTAAFADYDRDGNLDLYVTRYAVFDRSTMARRPTATTLFRDIVGPDSLVPMRHKPIHCALFRGHSNGTFEDVTDAMRVENKDRWGMGVLFLDIDGDGWPDIYAVNDVSEDRLYLNRGGRAFEDVAQRAWLNDPRGSMGVTCVDLAGDGKPAMLVTHALDQENALWVPLPRLTFQDVAVERGLAKSDLLDMSWGCAFTDPANAGNPDLIVANGASYSMHYDFDAIERATENFAPQRLSFYRNGGGGQFTDVSDAGALDRIPPAVYRGLATGDLDNDGGEDVVLGVCGGPQAVLRNIVRDRGHWLEVSLVGAGRNRAAIGAKVRVTCGRSGRTRWLITGDSFQSSSSPVLHFGLGPETVADEVRVDWPSGRVTRLPGVPVDRILRIVEDAGQALH